MDGLWAGLLAAYFLKRRSPRGAWVILGAVLSHWLLDWISHRPDMPLAPGGHNNLAGPPPPNPQAAPVASLLFFSLAVAWAYWMNHLRPVSSNANSI
jgi:hypothetical protein